MKAIHVHEFGEPEAMRLEEVTDPQAGSGQVVVRVQAVGVNPVDTYIRAGLYANKPSLPYTPGKDAAGVIESIGADVRNMMIGDRVYVAGTLSGAYAEKCLCDARSCHALPAHLTFQQGAAVGVPYATAHRALFGRASAKAGETVLIHGATGGVGIAAIQLAVAAGLNVISTGGTDKGRQLILGQGAHHALDHHAPNYLDEMMRLTNGRGADVIIEMLANENLGKDLTALAFGGRVVVVGSRGTIEINPRDVMSREAAIYGMSLFNLTPDENTRIHAALVAGLANKTLHPIVGREMPLVDAPSAHRAVMEAGAHGKIVLIPES
ncbi:MAG: zinc-binding alcohol dehydrogenase family protein [Pyrinomonadaceae bacterium]